MDIKSILAKAVEMGASDIHIVVGMAPLIRVTTDLFQMSDMPQVDRASARKMLTDMLDESKIRIFEEKLDFDFSTTIDNGTRFRVNVHYERGSICFAFRVIASDVPHIDTLGLPEKIKELTDLPRGLVLVTGPTGSGKSTTLASMIDQINRKYHRRVITLEDPIEYAMTNKSSVITQREIGMDCASFASGLRHALRQDPDVILVGEMRDLETAAATVTAAETGHLVFSTLHTMSAPQTIDRIIDIYPASQQNQIRAMLANTLQAVISQTLFKRADQPGMIPCIELLLCTSAVRNCIRENRVFEISNCIETGSQLGMQTMDQSIAQMCKAGYIDQEEALAMAKDPKRLVKALGVRPEPEPVSA
jgi:twitching motility protein PilT